MAVSADFRGKSWAEFATHLHENGIGYFTPEVRAQIDKQAGSGPERLAALYKEHLPRSLKDLKDNPGRSLIGIALEGLNNIVDLNLVDYVEFELARKMAPTFLRLGIHLESLTDPTKITSALIEPVRNAIAQDPEILGFLLSRTRPGVDPELCRTRILAGINTYRAETLGLEAVLRTDCRVVMPQLAPRTEL